MDVDALRVRLQLFVFEPPLEQPPDQMASRPLTLSHAGLEETHSPSARYRSG